MSSRDAKIVTYAFLVAVLVAFFLWPGFAISKIHIGSQQAAPYEMLVPGLWVLGVIALGTPWRAEAPLGSLAPLSRRMCRYGEGQS